MAIMGRVWPAALGALCITAGVEGQGREIPMHRLSRPYISGGVSIPNWSYGKNTIVTGDQIRLTSDRQSQLGYIWNTRPLTKSDWEVTFEYRVHGMGTRLFGDGFAFWFISQESYMDFAKSGYVGPSFGGPSTFDGMLLYFDTYRNSNYQHQFPWIGLMHGTNGNAYDPETDNKEHELDGCLHRFRNTDQITKVRIINMRGTLGVYTSKVYTGFPDAWEECILVTDIWLPRIGHLGFTAHTGEVADNHDIHSFSTNLIDYVDIPKRQRDAMEDASHRPATEPTVAAADINKDAKPAEPADKRAKLAKEETYEHAFQKEDRRRGRESGETTDTFKTFVLFFLKFFLGLCGLAVVAVIVYLVYNRSKGSRNAQRFT